MPAARHSIGGVGSSVRVCSAARIRSLSTHRPEDSSRRASRQLVDEDQIVERVAALGRGAAEPEHNEGANAREAESADGALSEPTQCGLGRSHDSVAQNAAGYAWQRLKLGVKHSLLGPGRSIAVEEQNSADNAAAQHGGE